MSEGLPVFHIERRLSSAKCADIGMAMLHLLGDYIPDRPLKPLNPTYFHMTYVNKNDYSYMLRRASRNPKAPIHERPASEHEDMLWDYIAELPKATEQIDARINGIIPLGKGGRSLAFLLGGRQIREEDAYIAGVLRDLGGQAIQDSNRRSYLHVTVADSPELPSEAVLDGLQKIAKQNPLLPLDPINVRQVGSQGYQLGQTA